MSTSQLYTFENTKMTVAILAIAALFIIFGGGFAVFLVEHEHPGANITQYGDAVWWAVVTIATVGYGDYYPVTAAGRIIAIFMMISGVGIFALMVATFAKRRLEKAESRRLEKAESKFGPCTKPAITLSGQETKTAIKTKVDEIEILTEEDFNTLIADIMGLRLKLLKGRKS
ncbi:MAG TPA: potassium channel family protein [Nitrososphaeraceae archaeon]|nr:potassium channel family protein [Nitrososphaeraceae archaeon]